jgi:hypothetical protein
MWETLFRIVGKSQAAGNNTAETPFISTYFLSSTSPAAGSLVTFSVQ